MVRRETTIRPELYSIIFSQNDIRHTVKKKKCITIYVILNITPQDRTTAQGIQTGSKYLVDE